MSNAPYLLSEGARADCAWAIRRLIDHMFFDGLQSPFDGNMMGYFARCDARSTVSSRARPAGEFAAESVRRGGERRRERLTLHPRIAAVTVQ
jgi:acetyl-CoA C-acetyltransferase